MLVISPHADAGPSWMAEPATVPAAADQPSPQRALAQLKATQSLFLATLSLCRRAACSPENTPGAPERGTHLSEQQVAIRAVSPCDEMCPPQDSQN